MADKKSFMKAESRNTVGLTTNHGSLLIIGRTAMSSFHTRRSAAVITLSRFPHIAAPCVIRGSAAIHSAPADFVSLSQYLYSLWPSLISILTLCAIASAAPVCLR